MQSIKIILACLISDIFYGILHDQFTAYICVEYFSVFHPPVFNTESPFLLALGWGVLATWWMGAFLGVLLALSSRAGSRRKTAVAELVRPIMKLLVAMACAAFAAGCLGYALSRSGAIAPPEPIASVLPQSRHARFMADWWAHKASYFVGFFGGMVLCVITFRKRRRALSALETGR
ncbi:MAG TPA: hypothetical protein VE783_08145 [Candidatus Limnocylindrales bacterium]|nr:hypothetical protein [Candidatus Limnocylindrales bacterium]